MIFNRFTDKGIIINGDCLDFIQNNLSDDSIDLICSDPPYMVNYKGGNYDDSEETIKPLIPLWFKQWYRVLKNDSFMFLFVGVKTLHTWIDEGIKAGFDYKNVIATSTYHSDKLRVKNNFNFQFQPVILFSKGKGKQFNLVDFIPTSECWLNDKRNKNPKKYTYDYPDFIKPEWAFSTIKRKHNERLHPNEKNSMLIKFFIELTTQENDIVLEPFLGSGTTAIACIDSNRRFIGCELNPDYYNITKNRIISK